MASMRVGDALALRIVQVAPREQPTHRHVVQRDARVEAKSDLHAVRMEGDCNQGLSRSIKVNQGQSRSIKVNQGQSRASREGTSGVALACIIVPTVLCSIQAGNAFDPLSEVIIGLPR